MCGAVYTAHKHIYTIGMANTILNVLIISSLSLFEICCDEHPGTALLGHIRSIPLGGKLAQGNESPQILTYKTKLSSHAGIVTRSPRS